jgi:N-acetylneuraminic acid mutarotase
MPIVRSHFGSAAWNGRIYVFGGGGEGFKSLNLVHIYDPGVDQWSTGHPMPTTRSGVVAVTLEDRIYVMGGGFKKPDGTFNFLTTVEIYDPTSDRWKKGSDLLMRHDAPAALVLDRKIYLFGGHHPNARGGPLTDPATNFSEVLDTVLGRWDGLMPMPTPRFSLAAVALGGKILAMGGGAFKDGVFRNFDLVEVYDPEAKSWVKESGMSLPWPSAGLGGCILDDRVYVFGGNNGERIQDRGAFYDPGEKQWLDLAPMREPRAAMGVAVLDGAVYVMGGRGANNVPVDSMEVLAGC